MAATPDHGRLDETLQGVHRGYQGSFANNAARTGATGFPGQPVFSAADVGKFARQTDNNTIWMLTATTPTWVLVGFQPDSARVIRTTDQTIGNNAVTAISFGVATYNHGRGLWVIGSPTRVTAVIPGVYSFTGAIRYAANATGLRSALLRANGSTLFSAASEGNPSGTNDTPVVVAGEFELAAAEYVELTAYQNSGGDLIAQAQPSYANFLTVSLVRPT